MHKYNDELRHYGVLGMKWGVHRAASRGKEYSYKSFGTKHNERKSKRLSKKIEKAEAAGKSDKAYKLKLAKKRADIRAKRSSAMDKREEEYARLTSTGGNIALRILTAGAVGGKPYQQYVAMMKAQAPGINLRKIAAAAGAYIGGRPLSTAVKAVYIRSDKTYNDTKLYD